MREEEKPKCLPLFSSPPPRVLLRQEGAISFFSFYARLEGPRPQPALEHTLPLNLLHPLCMSVYVGEESVGGKTE